MAQSILGNDINKLQDLLRVRNRQRGELRRQQEEEMVSITYAFLAIDYLNSTVQIFTGWNTNLALF